MREKFMSKQMKIYFAVAFLFPYLLGILMGWGYSQGKSLDVFPNAQMYYPAAGVMIAALLCREGDSLIPKKFFVGFILISGLMAVISVGSLFITSDIWLQAMQAVIILGSLLLWILLFTEKKEKRAAYGLRGKAAKASIAVIAIFIAIYFLRFLFSYVVAGQLTLLEIILEDATIWLGLVSLPLNFFLVFAAFFGEEYGWRYYLQPALQKRFGLHKGILVLGIIWGLWHLPINFFYYSTPASGIVSVCIQLVTCTSIGIFFAYGYMKTGNIWVPVILHFLNNNMAPILSGSFSSNAFKNQQVSWSDIPMHLIISLVCFGGFFLTKYFRDKKYALPTLEERVEAVKLESQD